MKFTIRVIIVMVTFCLAEAGKAQPFDYPPSRQVDVVDDYQGVKISDPYRWLEDLNSAETKIWIDAQNALTMKYLESLPIREVFRRRITELWNYPKVSLPSREGVRLWYRRNSGLERQPRRLDFAGANSSLAERKVSRLHAVRGRCGLADCSRPRPYNWPRYRG